VHDRRVKRDILITLITVLVASSLAYIIPLHNPPRLPQVSSLLNPQILWELATSQAESLHADLNEQDKDT